MRLVWHFVITWLLLGLLLLAVGLFAGAWEPILAYAIVSLMVAWPGALLLWEMDQ